MTSSVVKTGAATRPSRTSTRILALADAFLVLATVFSATRAPDPREHIDAPIERVWPWLARPPLVVGVLLTGGTLASALPGLWR
jgi:hypothetical protein